jgi:hypothetical protein
MSRSRQTWLTAVMLIALFALGVFIAWPIGVVDLVFLSIYVVGALWIVRGTRR